MAERYAFASLAPNLLPSSAVLGICYAANCAQGIKPARPNFLSYTGVCKLMPFQRIHVKNHNQMILEPTPEKVSLWCTFLAGLTLVRSDQTSSTVWLKPTSLVNDMWHVRQQSWTHSVILNLNSSTHAQQLSGYPSTQMSTYETQDLKFCAFGCLEQMEPGLPQIPKIQHRVCAFAIQTKTVMVISGYPNMCTWFLDRQKLELTQNDGPTSWGRCFSFADNGVTEPPPVRPPRPCR